MKDLFDFFKTFLETLNKKWFALVFDIIAIPFSWCGAYWLRHNMAFSTLSIGDSFHALMILFCIQITCYYYFKVYRGVWSYSSIYDVSRIIKAVISSIFLTIPSLYLMSLLDHIPRTIFPLYAILLIISLCSARLVVRSYREYHLQNNSKEEIKRVLIVGAGSAAESLVRDLRKSTHYRLVGLVDDHLAKQGMDIHSVRVLGRVVDMPDIVLSYCVDLIFIAIPSAGSAVMRHLVNYCEKCHVPFLTLPCVSGLLPGQISLNALREVNIEDLLGRDQVTLEWGKIQKAIKNKRILVTGGGGSIGSELCRQVMGQQPAMLLVVDNSEFNLYKIKQELLEKYPNTPLECHLLSITDQNGVNTLMDTYQPQFVFHAAAYKHVPMLEKQVCVAVYNNVIGTQFLAEASARTCVEKFILISSDKAVNPVNVMGATKRVAEIFCQNFDKQVKTQFITVRFGNVLGSTGSVVPLFQEQINKNQPLTVTHPAMQRYFMTIIEACQLILQATVLGAGGEIFVLDMGEPIKITYLAERMIKLAGKDLHKESMIQYTGLRPGEKLFEELFHESEHLIKTPHEKLLMACVRHFSWEELIKTFHLLKKASYQHHSEETYILLKSLVPEFMNTGSRDMTPLMMKESVNGISEK